MAAHPGLSASYSPYGKLFAQAKQSGEQHEQEACDSVSQSQAAAASWSLGNTEGIGDIDGGSDGECDRAADEPFAVGVIDQHFQFLPLTAAGCASKPAKNS